MSLIPYILISLFPFLLSCSGINGQQSQNVNKKESVTMNEKEKITRTEEEWKKILTPEQYRIMRQKGTEAAFSGEYYLTKDQGVYQCAACGFELFTSDNKFDSGCGWPSFDAPVSGKNVSTAPDKSHGMIRTEILCTRCGAHLGHVFDDGPTKTGLRYCVNSLSLKLDTTLKK